MICCIPTKGRPSTKTYELFESAGIDVYHFVEPQDVNKYSEQPNVVSIQKNDKGISYARNFILDWAKENNQEWIVVCDDDVSGFGVYDGGNRKMDASVWLDILEKVKGLPFELVGINYRQHAWHEKTSVSINRKLAEVCVLMNAKKISWTYADDIKEDRDFLLQTIKNGYGTVRFNKYFFSCPVVGTNVGGLHTHYSMNRDTAWAVKLVEKWHPYASLVRKPGRIDAKINITAFAKAHRKTVK